MLMISWVIRKVKVMKEKNMRDYFIGLDLGTNSVGWAVTDIDYNLMKANRKYLWGVRLFDTANTAKDRRMHRAARRRNQRKVQRLNLLKEIFEKELEKVDKNFLLGLKESSYHKNDRSNPVNFSLFNDSDFTDKDYYNKYPTIYHLRSFLIHNPNSNVDVRELFLAINSILKTRGHFLFSGDSLDSSSSLLELIDSLKETIYECFNISLRIDVSDEEFGNILKLKRKTEKRDHLNKCFIFSSDDDELEASSAYKNITTEIKLAIGSSYFRVSKLFNNEEYSEFSPDKVEFDKDNFEIVKEDLEVMLTEEEFRLVEVLEAIYNWSLLSEILKGHEFISDAKVEEYQKHKSDLIALKSLVRTYEPKKYNKAFKSMSEPTNYVHYIGKGSRNGELVKTPYKSKCSQEDVNKYFLKMLKPHENKEDQKLSRTIEELETKNLLPKLRVTDNRVIPHQLHLKELRIILNNYKNRFPFLATIDEDGFSPIDKIISMAKFRIPYYVGPLNTYHNRESEQGGFAWMVRQANKEDKKIYPWNFEDVVDTKASAEKFIKFMTNECTYLIGEDVVPKNSLLYNKYMVLNELNNLKINSEPISVSLKQQLYEEMFLKSKTRVTLKRLKSFLVTNNIVDKNDDLTFTGIDNGFTNTLSSWIDFNVYIEDGILSESDVENIIEWKALFGEDDSILYSKIKENLTDKLNDEQINRIIKTIRNYAGWGRFSRKFLKEIFHENRATGEIDSIISLMWKTNNNLMELLSNRYDFLKEIDALNSDKIVKSSFTYESLVEPLQLSPAVKRPIWQTLVIVKELKKIMKKAPKKIFIEMAREKTNTGRTKSRKENLEFLYKSCKNDLALNKELGSFESKSDAELRNNRLYLYYTQMGKCLYSGEIIELKDIYNTNLYDIDHIYPQSLIKDDSQNNIVLVKASYNSEKGNSYPINGAWQDKMSSFWKVLLDKDFITKEKHYRLTRRTQLTNDELASFINRQIVETRQSTLQTARLLESIFKDDDTRIVYVKAPNVSNFRRDFDIPKSRALNDHHHAHDAYLNIVVGNVYDTKFTSNALNFILEAKNQHYNISKLFHWDVVRNNKTAWIADKKIAKNVGLKKHERLDETGSIKTIRKTFRNNQVLVTIKPVTGKGELFNLQPLKKSENLIPLKGSNPILSDTEKYGGYTKKSTGYFFIVEHLFKKEKIKQIRTVPIMLMNEIKNNEGKLVNYCLNELNLKEPKIIESSILMNEILRVDNFEMTLTGITGKRITANGTHQLVVPEKYYDYFVQIEKFDIAVGRRKISEFDENVRLLAESYSITKESNLKIYYLFLGKERDTIYTLRSGNQAKLLEEKEEIFNELNLLEQCKLLLEIVNLFTCNAVDANLKLIGGAANAGSVLFQRTIRGEVTLIRQSPTGIFVREVPIN